MKRNCVIYENIRIEMARKNLTILEIAKAIEMNRETLSRKLSGKVPITIKEAVSIQEKCFPDMDLKELFKECVTI